MSKLTGIQASPKVIVVVAIIALALIGYFGYATLREPSQPKPTEMPDWDKIHQSVKRQPSGFGPGQAKE